ncbi:MAG: RNA polymerase sigma factor [Runella zeae]
MISDSTLLERIKQNDRKAWQELYASYKSPIGNFMRNWSCKGPDFDDVYQETMIRFDAQCHTIRLDATLKTIIISIAKRVWFETLRNRKKYGILADEEQRVFTRLSMDDEVKPDSEEPFFNPEEEVFDISGKVVEAMLKMRSGDCADIFYARYWYKIRVDKVAEQFGINYNSMKTKIYECKQSLKRLLQKAGVKFPTSKNSKNNE